MHSAVNAEAEVDLKYITDRQTGSFFSDVDMSNGAASGVCKCREYETILASIDLRVLFTKRTYVI